MDNRLIILYCVHTELWGRRLKGRAGNEETGARRGAGGRQIPLGKRGADAEAVWPEASDGTAKKSRYRCVRTRTVNRHRWMRRES